jgi:hypothetical protein
MTVAFPRSASSRGKDHVLLESGQIERDDADGHRDTGPARKMETR